jgi:hypothetical protein
MYFRNPYFAIIISIDRQRRVVSYELGKADKRGLAEAGEEGVEGVRGNQ